MKMVDEFKEFIQRGNVMDMAVGIIVGGAFTAIVTALTDSIIKPIIALISGDVESTWCVPGTAIDIGAFIGAIINFLLIALVVFFLVKGLNKMKEMGKKEKEEDPEVPAPTCPFCLEEVKEGATRCPHCAGEFAEPAKTAAAE